MEKAEELLQSLNQAQDETEIHQVVTDLEILISERTFHFSSPMLGILLQKGITNPNKDISRLALSQLNAFLSTLSNPDSIDPNLFKTLFLRLKNESLEGYTFVVDCFSQLFFKLLSKNTSSYPWILLWTVDQSIEILNSPEITIIVKFRIVNFFLDVIQKYSDLTKDGAELKSVIEKTKTLLKKPMSQLKEMADTKEQFDRKLISPPDESLIKSFGRLFDPDDILGFLNAIELLDQMSASEIGLDLIEDLNLLPTVFRQFSIDSNIQDLASAFHAIIIPTSLSILAHISHSNNPQLIQKYKSHFYVLYPLLNSDHLEFNEFAITAIGKIGSNPLLQKTQGKTTTKDSTFNDGVGILFAVRNDLMTNHRKRDLFSIYNEFSQTSNRDLKISYYHSLANLLHNPQRSDEHLESVKEIILRPLVEQYKIHEDLLKALRDPFEDKRFAVFHLFQGLVCHPYTLELIFHHTSFPDFLYDRTTETSAQGREWKFAIVETAFAIGLRKGGITVSHLRKLEYYQHLGVHYRELEVRPAVADETDD